MSGILYIVATPIGNLEDISMRALDALRSSDLLAVEDTRRTLLLLNHHGIKNRMVALHEHNEESVAPGLIAKIQQGMTIALLSDAGTPLLSDPGFRLVRLAGSEGIAVSPIPGPSAITAALSVGGLPTDRFTFEGFLPSKSSQRLKRLQTLVAETRTMVFFESSHRIEAFLTDLETVFGDERSIVVCRELTKTFETVYRGSITETRSWMRSDPNQRKGEFVVLLSGGKSGNSGHLGQAAVLAKLLLDYMPPSQAARIAGQVFDVSRRDIYPRLPKKSD
jgi:16S rRNA (cytidine1402-2'-O)-methyltransferase